MPALPRLVGLNGRSPSQARKSPVCPLYSWIRCGARSRNLPCMRVVHRSGGSSTWESAESTWLTIRSFLILTLREEEIRPLLCHNAVGNARSSLGRPQGPTGQPRERPWGGLLYTLGVAYPLAGGGRSSEGCAPEMPAQKCP